MPQNGMYAPPAEPAKWRPRRAAAPNFAKYCVSSVSINRSRCGRVDPMRSWRRQHGPLVMAYWGQGGAAKRDVRRRNQNSQNEPGMCPGINSFTFWRLTSPSQIGPAGRLAAPGREAQRSGRNRGRTLTAKELTNLTRYRVESKGDNRFWSERTALG